MTDPSVLAAFETDVYGNVDTTLWTVEADDQSVRLGRADGSDIVFNCVELFVVLRDALGKARAA